MEGYFNDYLARPEGAEWDEDIVAVVAAAGLEDMLAHFLPRQITWY